MQPQSPITVQQLTMWADAALRINHLNTLVQREIEAKDPVRAVELSERARRSAWELLNQLFAAGAVKPEGYAEPGARPPGSTDV
jgi:hypothetical protein